MALQEKEQELEEDREASWRRWSLKGRRPTSGASGPDFVYLHGQSKLLHVSHPSEGLNNYLSGSLITNKRNITNWFLLLH